MTKQPKIPERMKHPMKNDPALFARIMFGLEFTEQQEKIAKACNRMKKRIAIKSGHGIGKTTFLAVCILQFVATRDSCLVIVAGPKEDQIKHQVWAEARRLWYKVKDKAWARDIAIDLTRMYRKSNSGDSRALIQACPKHKPEALSGWHHDHLLIITDESSGIDDELFEPLSGALTKPDNRWIMTSNPTRKSGYFYNAFNRNAKNWTRLSFSSLDSPIVAKGFAKDIEDQFGKSSNVYRYRVLGKFPLAEDDSLILFEHAEAASMRHADNSYDELIIGVDPGRSVDGDATGIIARCGNKILASKRLWIADLMEVTGHAKQLKVDLVDAFPDLEFSHFAVDTVGLGAGVADSLRSQGEEVIDVNVAEKPSENWSWYSKYEPERLRDELWMKAKAWCEGEGSFVGLEADDKDLLLNELTAPKYAPTNLGKIKVEAKKDMKKRGISSPNLADALCCTFAHATQGEFWIEA